MVVKCVIHPDCNKEVVGVVLRILREKVNVPCEVIEPKDYDVTGEGPAIVLAIGENFDQLNTMITQDIVICQPELKSRFGLAIGGISPVLTEIVAFKIRTLDHLNNIIDDINGVIGAAQSEN